MHFHDTHHTEGRQLPPPRKPRKTNSSAQPMWPGKLHYLIHRAEAIPPEAWKHALERLGDELNGGDKPKRTTQ